MSTSHGSFFNLKKTSKQYASVSTVHGVSYVVEEGRLGIERFLWIVIVAVALAFTVFQVITLYKEWEEEPAITTLNTESLPIQKIQFPAVTICPQGSVNNIVDKVLFKQLIEYIKVNTLKKEEDMIPKNFSDQQILSKINDFLGDMYPGAHDNPSKYVRLLVSNNPQRTLETDAILDVAGDVNCDESNLQNFRINLDEHLNAQKCPDGFEVVNNRACLHIAENNMTYEEATGYCREKGGYDLMLFEVYDAINEVVGKTGPG